MGSVITCFREVKNPLLFHIGNPEAQPSNQIKTTSYNILTFLPLATLMQFKRLANVYFLVTAILQFIPAISPLSPISAIAPLIFVLAVSLIRTAIEQINKYQYDRQANSSKFLVYEQPEQEEQSDQQQQQKNQPPVRQVREQNKKNIFLGKWQLRCSNELHVGNLIKIQQNQRFPADIILLSTSNKDGKVYIETSSLDGEKNLKIKTVLTTTQQLYASLQTISKIKENKPLVTIEQPNQQLYNFNAMLQCKHESFLDIKTSSNMKNKPKQSQFIKINQFLYREAVLRNTQHIVGVIAYVGNYTKSMMNSTGGLDKMSKLERKVNFYMVFIFIFQFGLIILCGVLRVTFFYNSQVGRNYNSIILQIQNPQNYIVQCILTQCTYFILLNTMIPISLLVSIQVVKFGQGVFITYDKLMSKKQLSGVVINSKAFRSSINEQLGMVQYIFTDKTGTLTKNQMVLQETIIGNISYQNQQQGQNSKLYYNSKLVQLCYNSNGEQFRSKFMKQLKEYIQKLQEREKNKRERRQDNILDENNRKFMNTLMMVIMSTCHECILVNQGGSDLEYQGSSPDQITLVDSAARLGFKFIQNSYNKITLQISRSGINLTSVQFKVQQIFQFNSDRKRMSIILSHQLLPEYKILFCKGADSVIDRLLTKQYKDMEKESLYCKFYNKIKGQISEHSKIGLRTLLFGYKFIKNSQYQILRQKLIQYSQFSKDTTFNSINTKQSIINILEQNLHLCGATAVQDKLQNQVQNVIEDLIKANIKVCMLTGDKLETAQNIAKSCRLFKEEWKIIRIAEGSGQIDIFRGYCLVKDYVEAAQQYGVIIEGSAIDKAINSIYFADILGNCAAAVCCRITPKNKAEVVNFAKNSLNKLVLSIGDGANDVPMIQAAHIGIGLYGNQGMNAVQASDFAIPEFRCLWRLLFVHGRWNYLRIAQLIKYFFYKNIVFTLGQLWYAYFCSFSGTSIYNATYLVLFNTIFTGGPVVMRALLEQDLNYIQIIKEVKRLNLKQQKKVKKELKQELLHKQQVNTKNNINQSNKQNNGQDSSSQSQEETEQKSIKVSRLMIDKNMKCLFPLLYSHTQQQKSLTPRLFVLLIIQSICESFGIFLIMYYGIQAQQLWIFSVCLYTTVLALVTIRICYDITYWTWLIVFIILFTSVLPYIGFVYIMSVWETQLSGTFEQMLKMPDFYLCLGLALGIGSFLQASFNIITKYYFPQSIDFVRKQWKMMRRQEQKISFEERKLHRRKTIESNYKQILKTSRQAQDSRSGSSQKNSEMKKKVQIQLKQIKKTKSQISVTFSNYSQN